MGEGSIEGCRQACEGSEGGGDEEGGDGGERGGEEDGGHLGMGESGRLVCV